MPISDRKFNFQITDLSQGQLAEANIAGFDSSEKPNAGTILIDHDANGVGWFIDETSLPQIIKVDKYAIAFFCLEGDRKITFR